MSQRTYIVLLLLVCSLFSCRRSDNQSDRTKESVAGKQEQVRSSHVVDTPAVFRALRFNKEDSLYIHNSGSSSGSFDGATEFYTREPISPHLGPFDVRAVLSIRREDDISHLGSYAIIYRSISDTSSPKRIRGDSIEIITPALSSIEPAISFIDFNHDGYNDIHISFTQNTAGACGFNSFLKYDTTSSQFVPDTTLESLFGGLEIFIDEDANTITEGGRIGLESYELTRYTWNGSTYALASDESSEPSEDGRFLVNTKKEFRNGEWIVVSSDSTPQR